jgi:hypothetical protein
MRLAAPTGQTHDSDVPSQAQRALLFLSARTGVKLGYEMYRAEERDIQSAPDRNRHHAKSALDAGAPSTHDPKRPSPTRPHRDAAMASALSWVPRKMSGRTLRRYGPSHTTIKSFPTMISPLKYFAAGARQVSSLMLSMAGIRCDRTRVLTPAS